MAEKTLIKITGDQFSSFLEVETANADAAQLFAAAGMLEMLARTSFARSLAQQQDMQATEHPSLVVVKGNGKPE